MSNSIKASKREDLTRSNTNQLRQEGQVPGVVYGKDHEPETIALNRSDLTRLIRDQGKNAIFSLEIGEEQTVDVMFHQYQVDPLKSDLLHVDFYKADMTEDREVSVPIKLSGEPASGIVQQPIYEVQLRAKPGNIPEELSVDISSLEMGDTLTIADLPQNNSYEVIEEKEKTIVTILRPASDKDLVDGLKSEEELENAEADETTDSEDNEEKE